MDILSETETALVNEWFSTKYRNAPKSSVADRLLRWKKFVEEITSGYTLTVDDYVNDLDERTILEEVMQQFVQLRPKLELLLKSIDDQFYKVTQYDETFAYTFRSAQKFPWRTRIPIKLVGELSEDIQNMTRQ